MLGGWTEINFGRKIEQYKYIQGNVLQDNSILQEIICQKTRNLYQLLI